MKFSHITLAGICALSAASGAYAIAQGGDLSLLESVERGMWQLRAVGGGPSGTPANQICVSDPAKLVQGQGQGLTTIRKESPRLIHIQSQGIRNNAPFSFSVEGRRMSAC